jgi:hypothetical protein
VTTVADPCQWASDGQCDVPGACEAGDYADCSAPSIAPSPPLAGRRLCIVCTSQPALRVWPGTTVALFRMAAVLAAAPFDGMIDSVTARPGVTFECSKDCRTATCTIDWSFRELTSLPENIGLLSCRGRITKMCGIPAYCSGSAPSAATFWVGLACGAAARVHWVVLCRDASYNILSSIPESMCLLKNLTLL